MTRKTLFFGFAAGMVGLALACSNSDEGSSSGGNGNGGSSGGTSGTSGGTSGTSGSGNNSSFKNCSITSGTSCTDAEMKPYSDCVNDKCDTGYKKCYGDGYKSGSFGGACGSWMTCVQKCDCDDTQCVLACPLDDACRTCSEEIATCGDSCTEPECAKNPTTPDGGGTGNATCADLQACCDAIQDADQKDGCQQAKDSANGNDGTCSQYLTGFKAAGLCN